MDFFCAIKPRYLGFLPSALLYLLLRFSHFLYPSHRAFFTKFSFQRFFVKSISPKTLRTSAKLIFDKKNLSNWLRRIQAFDNNCLYFLKRSLPLLITHVIW